MNRKVVSAFFIVFILVCSCSKKVESPKQNILSEFEGTYTGYLFPNEYTVLKKSSEATLNTQYYKAGQTFFFDLNYDSGVFDTLSAFKTKAIYLYQSNLIAIDGTRIASGRKDYDTINIGVQNAKLTNSVVFGKNYSLQFSILLNDSVSVVRTFQK